MRISRRTALILGCGPGLSPGSGCGETQRPVGVRGAVTAATPSTDTFPTVVRDDLGRRVRIPAAPRRIISLSPSHTECLYALGVGDHVIATDSYSDFPPSVKAKATLTCWPRPPMERIVALKPDLVVLFTESSDIVDQLQRLGIPVLKYFPTSIDGAYRTLRSLGQAVGRQSGAQSLIAEMQQRLRDLELRLRGAKPRRVMFELDAMDPARPFVAGGAGLYGEAMERAGALNVFGDVHSPAFAVSAEQVLLKSPEVILLGDSSTPVNPQSPAKVAARPGWGPVPAVRSGWIFPVKSELLTRASPRLIDGIREIARRVHPDRFPTGSPAPTRAR